MKWPVIRYLREVLVPLLCENGKDLEEYPSIYKTYLKYEKNGTITIEEKSGGNKIVTVDDILASDLLFFSLETDLKKAWVLSLDRKLSIFKDAGYCVGGGWLIETGDIDMTRKNQIRMYRNVIKVREVNRNQYLETAIETRSYGIIDFLFWYRNSIAKI